MKQITLNAKDYNDIMKAVKPVVGKDPCRPQLSGVYLEVEGNTARFTTCNGCVMTRVAREVRRREILEARHLRRKP